MHGSAPAGLDRLRRVTWWSTVGLILVAGTFVASAAVVTEPMGVPTVAVAVGALAAAVAAAGVFADRLAALREPADMEPRPIRPGMVTVAALGAVVVVMAAQWTSAGTSSWGIVPGLVAGAVGAHVEGRRMALAVVGTALVAGAVAAVTGLVATGEPHLSGTAQATAIAALVGGGLVGALWTWQVADRLDRARRLERQLAVADERLRFAADLHDIQGHHLEVIARYGELAGRLVDEQPQVAAEHMRAVEQHARTALQETRSVVQGYRRVPLDAELTNAVRVLAAAGTDSRLLPGTRAVAADVAEPARGLLGLVVREATTNILRHSRADHATIRLEVGDQRALLRVTNDGAAEPADGDSGSGLAGLARRLGSVGGRLDWQRHGDRFVVTAAVPVAPGAAP